MDLDAAFAVVRNHLRPLGIATQEHRNPPASEAEILAAEESIGGRIPVEFRACYATYGNGLWFRWAFDEDFDDADIYGEFEFAKLRTVIEYRTVLLEICLDLQDPSNFKEPIRAAAAKTLAQMQHWLPFWEECNGDQFCLDLRNGAVVYHNHDWFDGGDGTNGHVMAPSLAELVNQWQRVCFTHPSWWPDAFSNSGIDWASEEFDDRYRIV